jgi:hypothetical protein
MDVAGAIEGADKSSSVTFCWDYLKHLEPLFAPFRDAPINVIEVGVHTGPSIRLWKWYFSRATIVGIDINQACRSLAGGRVHIEIGSQDDPAFLTRVCGKYPPTIFIDDGSHLATHNIFTFEHVFPLLAPGGLYVVEDLAFHLGAASRNWQGTPPRNAPEYFLDLARSRLARVAIPGAERPPASLVGMIDSLQFIDSAVILRKKYAARDRAGAVAQGRAYLASQPASQSRWLAYAAYLLKHEYPLDLVEEASRHAIEAGGRTVPALTLLADILLRQGQNAGARTVLEEAGALAGTAGAGVAMPALINLARVEGEAGLVAAAIRRLEGVLATTPSNGAARIQLDRLRRASPA